MLGRVSASEIKQDSQNDLSRLAEDHLSDIVDTVHFRMVELEYTNDVIGLFEVALVSLDGVYNIPVSTYPGCDDRNCQQNDNAWYHSQSVKDQRNRKYAETDLCFHHENRCSHPANLRSV